LAGDECTASAVSWWIPNVSEVAGRTLFFGRERNICLLVGWQTETKIGLSGVDVDMVTKNIISLIPYVAALCASPRLHPVAVIQIFWRQIT
jgi:hypothetical protein